MDIIALLISLVAFLLYVPYRAFELFFNNIISVLEAFVNPIYSAFSGIVEFYAIPAGFLGFFPVSVAFLIMLIISMHVLMLSVGVVVKVLTTILPKFGGFLE